AIHFVIKIKYMNNKNDLSEPKNEQVAEHNQNNSTEQTEEITNTVSSKNTEEDNNASVNQEDLLKKINTLEEQLSELNDKYIRLLAEFDNFKKRSRKEKEDLLKYAGEDVWKNILPIMDDFERALKENQNTNDIEIVKKGFELIYNKMKHLITKNNITPIDCLHKEFDPDIMEAMAKTPAPSDELKGKVIDELEKAYQMNGKIIRFAKVIVAE
ncbi:MAG: nucleotide exchange factor GrpE, partial [Bacteroidia bacterium]|nr:nucleotide exchange factor GrpE [Bacteroidia bacterium]